MEMVDVNVLAMTLGVGIVDVDRLVEIVVVGGSLGEGDQGMIDVGRLDG